MKLFIRDEESGFALVTAVWLTLLLSLMAAGLMRLVLTSRQTLSAFETELQDKAIAESAVEIFMSRYFYNVEKQTYHDANFELLDRQIFVTVAFESGKININRAKLPLLSALFASKGLSSNDAISLASAIIDWRDADQIPLASGAEIDAYFEAGMGVSPRNGAFETVGEVRHLLGMTPELYACLRPTLTVYSLDQTGAVDIPRAGVEVRNVLFWAYENDWLNEEWPSPSDPVFNASANVISGLSGHALSLRVTVEGEVSKLYSQKVRFKTLSADIADYARLSPIRPAILDPVDSCAPN